MRTAIARNFFWWEVEKMTCNREKKIYERGGCAVRTAIARKKEYHCMWSFLRGKLKNPPAPEVQGA